MGKVGMDRYNRDIAMIQCPYVGVGAFVFADELARKPIIITPVWTDAMIKALFPVGMRLAAYLYPLNLFTLELGNIYIEYHPMR